MKNGFIKSQLLINKLSKILVTTLLLTTNFSCKNPLDGKSKDFKSLQQAKKQELDALTTKVQVRYCPAKSSETVSENLLLIAMDFSGSNTSRESGCFTGTDENQIRLHQLIKFIKKQTVNPEKSNLHIALIPFGTYGDEGCYRIFNGRSSSFTQYENPKDSSDESHEIFKIIKLLIEDEKELNKHNPPGSPPTPGYSQFLPPRCRVWTNYLDTIDSMAKIKREFMEEMKRKYPENGKDKAMVFINGMFISDGEPLVGLGVPGQTLDQNDFKIFSSISNFKQLHNDKSNSNIKNVFTFLNTAYYTARFEEGHKHHSGCQIPISSKRKAIKQRCQKASCALANGATSPCGKLNPKTVCPKELEAEACTIDANKGKVILDDSVGSRLCDMSAIGGGNYFDLGERPDYNDFKMTSFYNSYLTEKIILQNKFSMWEQTKNGVNYTNDSDGDGLSDELEYGLTAGNLKLDPYIADTDGDGIRDSIEFYLNPSIGIEPLPSRCPKGSEDIDTDKDGFNNCEEGILGLDTHISDENLNKIPDWIDWKNKIQVNTTNSSNDLDGDGVANLNELYQNLPVNIHNQYLPKDISKQTEITVQDPENPACLITTIDKFRISDAKTPMTIQFWYYARQREGSLRHLVHGEFPLIPGEDKVIDASTYNPGVSYEGQ